MSKLSKALLFIGFIFLILWFVSMRALGGSTLPFVWVSLGIGVLSIGGAIVKDFNFFRDLFTQRATKHGMNLGVLTLLTLAILVGINFVGYRHIKKIDVTKTGVNSISEQTKSILQALKDDLSVKAFINDGQDGGAQQQKFRELIEHYTVTSDKVKHTIINPIKKPEEAKAYDITMNGTVVLEYKGRKTKIEDLTEQALTNAIIKITRDKNKVVYFVTGHGERDLEGADANGIQNFKKYIAETSYDVRTLSFIDKSQVPADADLVIISGPKQAYLNPEIKALKEYLFKGGKMLIALDPGSKTNLGQLTKAIGVEFKNNYILDQLGQLVGGGGATAVGITYSSTNEITKEFKQSMTIFHLASQVRADKNKPDAITVEDIVKSSPASFAKNEIKQGEAKFIEGKDEKGPLTIVASVRGKMKKEEGMTGEAGDFSAIVVGDSDFMTNQLVDAQLNHDLALNMVAYLAKDKELVTIRPKTFEGNTLTMTQSQSALLFYGLVFILPSAIFLTGGVVWFRRRAA